MKTLTLTEAYKETIGSKLKVMPDPVWAGKHPYHDSRWLVTGNAEIEWSHDQAEWRLAKGSLVAQMRDIGPVNSALLAHAYNVLPEVVAALQRATNHLIMDVDRHGRGVTSIDSPEALEQARAAIARANQVTLP